MNKRFYVNGGGNLLLIIFSVVIMVIFIEIQLGKAEGLAFAKNHDKRACVGKVIKGKRVCSKFSCFLRNRYFYLSCMDNAKPSVTLCQSISPIGSLFQFESWKNKQCQEIGQTTKACHHIWQKVRNSCKTEKVI